MFLSSDSWVRSRSGLEGFVRGGGLYFWEIKFWKGSVLMDHFIVCELLG